MNKNDVRIMGDGTVSGGSYGKVKITGDGRISGSLDADELHVMGNLYAEQDVKVGKLKVSGNGQFEELQANEIKISGNIEIKGAAVIKDVDVMGEIKAFKGIKAVRIKVRGSIDDRVSVEAEHFESYGGIDVNSLNADNIYIKLYGSNRANEIVGGNVEVIYPLFKKILLGMFIFKKSWADLQVDTIEADRIYLERTTANSVKGNDVNIGPGCKIKIVEYKEKIFIDKSSVVEQEIKV